MNMLLAVRRPVLVLATVGSLGPLLATPVASAASSQATADRAIPVAAIQALTSEGTPMANATVALFPATSSSKNTYPLAVSHTDTKGQAFLFYKPSASELTVAKANGALQT